MQFWRASGAQQTMVFLHNSCNFWRTHRRSRSCRCGHRSIPRLQELCIPGSGDRGSGDCGSGSSAELPKMAAIPNWIATISGNSDTTARRGRRTSDSRLCPDTAGRYSRGPRSSGGRDGGPEGPPAPRPSALPSRRRRYFSNSCAIASPLASGESTVSLACSSCVM